MYAAGRTLAREREILSEEVPLMLHVLRCLAVLVCVFLGVSATWAECECPPNSVEQGVLNADRIFRARVVSAELAELDFQTIEFVVRVDDTLRGNTGDQYRLTTALPKSCGVSVRLGFSDLYGLGPGETRVSQCTGSGRDTYMKYPRLAAAIALVDLPVSNSQDAERLFADRSFSSNERAAIDEFFELVERIDPTGNTATSTPDRIEYRGIVVHFKDGKYEKVDVQ